jgi:hypothetical protein
MIRRDYILRAIEECAQVLARVLRLVNARDYAAATVVLDQQFQTLVGTGADAVSRLSENELLARLMAGEPTAVVRTKCLLLVALLKQAAEVHAAQNRDDESQTCLLKALNLLLEVRLRDEELQFPDFVPRVEDFVLALEGYAVPPRTNAALMQHYERLGEFGKAEDRLFVMIDAEPENAGVREWGMAFYERLLRQSDAALVAGNLPRAEVEAGLGELQKAVPSDGAAGS